jgi:hypothetical protein
MTNLTKILIGSGIIGAGIIGTPMIYNNQIDKFIAQEKLNLQNQQIEMKETKNNDSFFETKRQYIITIKDITPLIEQTYKNIDFDTLKELKEAFDNTKFLVTLDIVKFPISHKDAVKIDLYSLNNNLTQELSTDKIGKQLLEAIKNKAFEVILDIDNLQISKARLKDIDLTLDDSTKNRTKKFNLTIKKAALNLENNALRISKIGMSSTEKSQYINETIDFNINGIDGKTEEKDLLNNSSTFKITSINYNEKSKYKDIKLNINNILNSSSTKTITNKTYINNKLDVNNIYLSNNKDYIKVNNFKYNFKILNLDATALKDIVYMTQNNNLNDKQKLIQDSNILIQKGFKVAISPLAINQIEGEMNNHKFNIKPITINFDATLLPNNYTLQSDNPTYLSNKINAKLNAQTSKENIALLTQINPQIGLILNVISKEKNNKTLINLEYKNSTLLSNGTPLSR